MRITSARPSARLEPKLHSGTNQRHLAPQHVDKLRQLVHTGVVEETPHSRLGWCAIPDPADPINVVRRDPEIEHGNPPTIGTKAKLAIEYGAGAVELDRQA